MVIFNMIYYLTILCVLEPEIKKCCSEKVRKTIDQLNKFAIMFILKGFCWHVFDPTCGEGQTT